MGGVGVWGVPVRACAAAAPAPACRHAHRPAPRRPTPDHHAALGLTPTVTTLQCRQVFAFTNHTVLPEALEKWPVSLVEKLLPRHMQIIYDINWRFIQALRAQIGDDHDRIARMSIIEDSPSGEKRVVVSGGGGGAGRQAGRGGWRGEMAVWAGRRGQRGRLGCSRGTGGPPSSPVPPHCLPPVDPPVPPTHPITPVPLRFVRMAYLAVVTGHTVNGVAAIHSDIIRDTIFKDFADLWPAKFQNKTNGVTPRRWLAFCNPPLAALLTKTLGDDGWINDLDRLAGLRAKADDPAFQAEWRTVKQTAKAKAMRRILELTGVECRADALLDIQVKRIHEYKRQLLNVLGIIWRYDQIKKMTPEQRAKEVVPRVCVIGGKAAPGYEMAKRIIKLVCAVGEKVNNDPDIGDLLKAGWRWVGTGGGAGRAGGEVGDEGSRGGR